MARLTLSPIGYSSTPKREYLLKGKKVHYDACANSSYISYYKAKKYYSPEYKYIGKSCTYYINGIENVSRLPYYFFVLK